MTTKLAKKIDELKQMPVEELALKFNCSPEEICMGDYIAKNTNDTVCPYKVIMGYANFENSEVTSLGNLEIVFGKKMIDSHGPLLDMYGSPTYLGLNVANSKIKSLGKKLRAIYGSINLNKDIWTLRNVSYLGSNLFVGNTYLTDLGKLEVIDGIFCYDRKPGHEGVSSLGNLRKIHRLMLKPSGHIDFANLEIVNILMLEQGDRMSCGAEFYDNFKRVNGRYERKPECLSQD